MYDKIGLVKESPARWSDRTGRAVKGRPIVTTATASTAVNIVAPTATLGDLAAIMADLTREHPEAGHRVQHGAFLALMGHAESDTATGWWVTNERDGEAQYFVLLQYGTCTCKDHQRHGHLSPCKHRLCVETLQRLERVETDREQRAAAPIAWELTDAAYTALAALGEPCALAPLCSRCGAEAAIPSHVDHLGAACIRAELFGDDAA